MSKTPKESQPKRKKKGGNRRSPKSDTENSASGWQVCVDVPRPPAFQPVAPDLWRTTMLDLRQRFQRKRDEDGALRCQLVQSSTADKEQLAALNRKQTSDSFVFCIGSEYVPFRVHRDREGKLLYTDVPTRDVEGKPIVDNAGRAILCDMPTG